MKLVIQFMFQGGHLPCLASCKTPDRIEPVIAAGRTWIEAKENLIARIKDNNPPPDEEVEI